MRIKEDWLKGVLFFTMQQKCMLAHTETLNIHMHPSHTTHSVFIFFKLGIWWDRNFVVVAEVWDRMRIESTTFFVGLASLCVYRKTAFRFQSGAIQKNRIRGALYNAGDDGSLFELPVKLHNLRIKLCNEHSKRDIALYD